MRGSDDQVARTRYQVPLPGTWLRHPGTRVQRVDSGSRTQGRDRYWVTVAHAWSVLSDARRMAIDWICTRLRATFWLMTAIPAGFDSNCTNCKLDVPSPHVVLWSYTSAT